MAGCTWPSPPKRTSADASAPGHCWKGAPMSPRPTPGHRSGGAALVGAVDEFAVQICRAQPLASSVAIRTLQRWIHRLGWHPWSMSCCLARSANLSSNSIKAGPCLPKTSTATPVTESPARQGYSLSLRASPSRTADLSSYLCAKGQVTVMSSRMRGAATSPHASTSTRGSFRLAVASSATTCSLRAQYPAALAACSKMLQTALCVAVSPPQSLHSRAWYPMGSLVYWHWRSHPAEDLCWQR